MKKSSAVFKLTVLIILIIALTGCIAAHGNEAVTEAPENTKPQETAPAEPSLAAGGVTDEKPGGQETPSEPRPEFTNPLTGLPSEADISLSRPLAVIFNNKQKATPQRGIGKADIIYEIPAEGGITRLMGIFMDISGVEQLGSIRSIRPYFIDIAKCLNPIIIHAGASDEAYVKMKNEGTTYIDGVNGSDYFFSRDPWRKKNVGYEHSLMADPVLIPEYLEKRKIKTELSEPLNVFSFGDSSADKGDAANSIKVELSHAKTTSFNYSENDRLYYANQFRAFMTDETTGLQIAVKNVIIMKTKTKVTDSEGRLAVTTTGSGEGWYACEGKYVPMKWSRASASEPFKYTLTDDTDIIMGAGVSYICIIPTNRTAAFE